MSNIISFLKETMEMARKFCCIFFSCLTSPEDTPSAIEEGGCPTEKAASQRVPSKDDGSSSSSVPKVSDLTDSIRTTADIDAIDGEELKVDLDELIEHITQLLETIHPSDRKKKSSHKKPQTQNFWSMITSTDLLSFKELLTGVKGFASGVKEIIPSQGSCAAKTVAVDILKGIGHLSLATAGLLVFATVLERFEDVSEIEEECLSLLDEMNSLAKHAHELQKEPSLKEQMKETIRNATELILEASILCCTQIDSSRFAKFFSMSENKKDLLEFKKELKKMYRVIDNQMSLCLFRANNSRRREKLVHVTYPTNAVGIDEPVNKVIELLDWESEEKAIAVVVHGFGGKGKTTLADAVCATLFDQDHIKGCKYSVVRLFADITSTPDIIDLQRKILKDLRTGTKEEDEGMPDIRRFEDGQQEIGRLLEKQVSFIYIDNVLARDQLEDKLEQLLPPNMGNAKKLRLLVTARDEKAVSVCEELGVKTEFYAIESLLYPKAMELFQKKLGDKEKQIHPIQMNNVIKVCAGVPKLLTVVAGFIISEPNAKEACRTVIEESETNWKGIKIGEDIKCYVFAYEKLDDNLRDPFLDICSFFQGSDWEALSNIVGESELESLEKRALVTRDVKCMTARVHDVILEIGLKNKGERFRFTCASEIQEFLHKEDEDLRKIKGIWSSDNSDPLYIPASKLDLMCSTLRVLTLGKSTKVKDQCQKIFGELVIFSAGISHLPFDVSKLKGFQKLSHLCYKPEDLQNLSQMPSNLRHIELELNSSAFQISSNCIKQLKYLRVLRLRNAELKILPQDLGDLGNGLHELNLSDCAYLEELPESISTLGSLRVLRMNCCYNLRQLPKDFGSLNSLQKLHLRRCESLKTLPSSLEKLTSLQELKLDQCENLKALPSGLGKLKSLQELDLGSCQNLEALPSSLEELSSLRLLNLSGCESIKDLPCGLGKLTSLAELSLEGCKKLSSIPESIGQLKLLRSIDLSGTDLKELPDGFCNLSIITEITMDRCHLEKLPDRFGEVTNLRKLSLVDCKSLKKLPESFSQLKYLEILILSRCKRLEELCIDFKGLSLLRHLFLNSCVRLKQLPQDFHCLTSLEDLHLDYCNNLGGKWMESIVKMKALQFVNIEGSRFLEESWRIIQSQCDHPWSFAVRTQQGLSNEDNLAKQLQSEFDRIFINGQGEPFHISDLPVNTLLLVMYDDLPEIRRELNSDSPFSLIEENINDIQTNFKMIYCGSHFDKLPKKVADRIAGHAPVNTNTRIWIEKVLPLARVGDPHWRPGPSFQMRVKVVSDENGNKYLSCWEILLKESVEEFVAKNCGRYLKLKQLVERPRESNIELLRELFPSGELGNSLGFLRNGASTKVGVEELKGKTILLHISAYMRCDIRSLGEMYVAEKERFGFEIITIPIMQENTKGDVCRGYSTAVPWLVLQNPWHLTNATKYFLIEGYEPADRSRWNPNIIRIIESNGTIAAHDPSVVLEMVNTWGTEAYPFTEERKKELMKKKRNK